MHSIGYRLEFYTNVRQWFWLSSFILYWKITCNIYDFNTSNRFIDTLNWIHLHSKHRIAFNAMRFVPSSSTQCLAHKQIFGTKMPQIGVSDQTDRNWNWMIFCIDIFSLPKFFLKIFFLLKFSMKFFSSKNQFQKSVFFLTSFRGHYSIKDSFVSDDSMSMDRTDHQKRCKTILRI